MNSSQILHYDSVRWIPLYYRRLLPLPVMKRYHCIAVGSEHGVLTVAFDERPRPNVLDGLRRLTGQIIFPVLVHPRRMRLLLQRAEFCQTYRVSDFHCYYLHRYFIHSTIASFASPFDKHKIN
ncbi:MAG: hypothetical protein ABI406_21260 [Ktedonobacteraceae bacterium]